MSKRNDTAPEWRGRKFARVIGVGVVALVLGPAAAWADPIAIVNANFQTVDLYGTDGDVPGFTATASFAALYDVPGYNVLDLNAPANYEPAGEGSVYQVLSATFAPGVYEFSSNVQSSYYGEYNGNDNDTFNGGEQISLVDANSSGVISSASYTPTDTGVHQVDLDFTILAGAPELGDPIELVITHTGEGDVFLNELSLQTVPEPASIAVLAVGVAGLAARRRKARR